MFDTISDSPTTICALRFNFRICAALCLTFLLLGGAASEVFAQTLERELDAPALVSLNIKNRNGRVNVIASDEQKKVTLKATSRGAAVEPADVTSLTTGGAIEINVRARREQDRIDLTINVPARARVKIESEDGAVSVAGNLTSAEVQTNTGTIHADVPLDALNFNFIWEASRPRFLSDVELPEVKEKRAGLFAVSGKLGDKKAKKEARTTLDFTTRRGIVLLNVDPDMVPSDLSPRPLTEAARAIVRSGNEDLIDAIRRVSPRLFGEYAQTLPSPKNEPALVARRAPGEVATLVSPQLVRLNASVTDRHGRAISNLQAKDFSIIENGETREVKDVTPASAPFNLVLVLDVSGSVSERIDFIRKAARNFLGTVSAQDRIAILSFRDDIQVISNFTTDRRQLNESLNQIDAGGGTALYDTLAYALVDTLKPLRGERTAIVVMSDGDDNKSFVPFGALLEATVESGALIYPLYIPSGLIPESSVVAPNTTSDPLRSRYLTLTTRANETGRKLAEASGGVYYSITRLDDLQRAYDDVVAQLRTSYTITYASNIGNTPSRRIRIRTTREGASVRLSPAVGVGQ
jgi:VWFA-related protein